MVKTSHAARLAENEVIFRQYNERVQKDLKKLAQEAKAEGYPIQENTSDVPLHFYCECSNEKCNQRIIVTTSQYNKLHQNRSQFLVLPSHNQPDVERIVKNTPSYLVVEKYLTPPKKATKLHPTPKKR